MDFDKTKRLEKLSSVDEANDYLRSGWTLINTCVVNHGEARAVDQQAFYIVGWMKDGEPVVPLSRDDIAVMAQRAESRSRF
jgi:hypothetical protein